jgi:hypothetical protein
MKILSEPVACTVQGLMHYDLIGNPQRKLIVILDYSLRVYAITVLLLK